VGPGFSERTFEFCYNAEYCQINAALLATHPHIPSQNAEKDLGYDVEFKINEGNYTKSLFLQHKVSSYAEVRAGRNAQFYAAHGGPYFRFVVDNEQHNVLCELSRTKGNAFYCGPRFHLRHELETHFRGPSIAANSVLLDPLVSCPSGSRNKWRGLGFQRALCEASDARQDLIGRFGPDEWLGVIVMRVDEVLNGRFEL
jgi:hypothetical protein